MDYEQKYNEALESARKLQENSNGMILDSNWFYEKMERADYDSIIEDLRKAMEE